METSTELQSGATQTTTTAAKPTSATDAASSLDVGQFICRSELVELAANVGSIITAAKLRMTSTYRSAKFRTQNEHPTRDFKIVTSATPHGDDHIIVTATLMRTV